MRKKIMAMLIAATCLATTALNSTVAVCAAEKSNPTFLMGDVNGDGSFGVSDVVLLQKWLLAVPDTHLANWRAADFCEDEKLDVFDLTLMKRELLKEINNPDEPPATEIAALEFNSTDDAVKAINANDLSDYYSPYREAYESMFKQFREEGFVYSVKTNDNVAFAENSKIRLFPDHALEDMCIKYSVMYQGKKYNISFRNVDMDVIAETDGITEYVRKRWGSNADHEIMIGDTTYTISTATDGSQIAAMAFIDVTHYIQVIGFESVEEEELTELLNALEYETLSLDTISEPPATEIGPLDYKTTNDVIKAINENDLSAYPSPYKEAYEQMFESFKNDGYIYSVKTDDNIILKNNSNVRLLPDHALEDMCIKYSIRYQDKEYNVSFRNANMDVVEKTNGITEYVRKRWGSNADHEIMIGDTTYTVSNASDGSQIAAMAFIDEKHYIQVIGYESATENDLKDLLSVLKYEKLEITGNIVTDPITPVNEKQSITFVTYDAYKEFVEQNDLPEGFVEYEQVKAIGSFNSLVFLSDARNADYSEYMYGFSEPSKNTVFLTIVPSSKENTSVISTSLSIDDINQSDMRFTKNKEVSGIFKIDDLIYKYIKGTLLSITWEKNDLRYTLSCASTFSDYQLDVNTFVSKMLVYELVNSDVLF